MTLTRSRATAGAPPVSATICPVIEPPDDVTRETLSRSTPFTRMGRVAASVPRSPDARAMSLNSPGGTLLIVKVPSGFTFPLPADMNMPIPGPRVSCVRLTL